MNFQVPQFIEIEDKVIGPFSFKQFIYLAGSIGLAFIVYVYVPRVIAIIPITIIVALGAALAFVKVNNRPFIIILQSAIRYYLSRKLYLWEKRDKPLAPKSQMVAASPTTLNQVSKSQLEELSWNLDITKKIN